ncbi:MAG: TIGR00730 family Rossman fold protein [Thermoanaerobaculia bacterium]|nr:TIGR00730 family Rossman fold protein [Thermoanaerobaculia bacterium]
MRYTVFCGSHDGNDPALIEGARELGAEMARRGIGLVYGGSRLGVMGAVAAGALDGGGEVIGVIPGALARREVAHDGLTELRVVGSMHERKAMMADLSDGFIALPGGMGTLDEFFESLTWAQLGVHPNPCGLLNLGGYWDRLLALLDQLVERGFARPEHRDMVIVEARPAALLDRFAVYRPPPGGRWVRPSER